MCRADRGRRSPATTRSPTISIPLVGNGTDQASKDALATLRDTIVPATVGAVAGRDGRTSPATTAATEDADANLATHDAAGVRRSCCPGVPAAAGHVPVDRHPDQGDRAQPAVGRGAAYGVLKLVFQDGCGEALLGLPADRRHRRLAAAVPVRDPVRPLDGLPRVHPEPGQGGWSTAGMTTNEAVAQGIKSTAGVGHRRGGRDGGGVLDLRHALADRPQADRRRPGRRGR